MWLRLTALALSKKNRESPAMLASFPQIQKTEPVFQSLQPVVLGQVYKFTTLEKYLLLLLLRIERYVPDIATQRVVCLPQRWISTWNTGFLKLFRNRATSAAPIKHNPNVPLAAAAAAFISSLSRPTTVWHWPKTPSFTWAKAES